jgi:hypothetical protein
VGGIVAVVMLVVLFGGLLRAIAQLTEQLWVRLLQFPVHAAQWLLTQGLYLLRLKPRPSDNLSRLNLSQSSQPTLNPVRSPNPFTREMGEIMVRLERLQQEQTLLLQDIKTLLAAHQGAGEQSERKHFTRK